MAAQLGSSLLIKIGNGASPEVFTTLTGLRTKTLACNEEMVDITTSDNEDKWRELLAGAGIRNMSASGAGVFKDGEPSPALRTDAMSGTLRTFEIVVPAFGTFTGPFQITQLQYAGEYNGEVTYDVTLESAGELVFAAAA